MKERIYIDTSAVAKWYLNEAASEQVERYLQHQAPVEISELTVVEMRSLLARRRRERSIDASIEMELFAAFSEDIRQGIFMCRPLLPNGRQRQSISFQPCKRCRSGP